MDPSRQPRLTDFFDQHTDQPESLMRAEQIRRALNKIDAHLDQRSFKPSKTVPLLATQLSNGQLEVNTMPGLFKRARITSLAVLHPHDYYEDPLTASLSDLSEATIHISQLGRIVVAQRGKLRTPGKETSYYFLSRWPDAAKNHHIEDGKVIFDQERTSLIPAIGAFGLGIALFDSTVHCFTIADNPNYEKTTEHYSIEHRGFDSEKTSFGPTDRRKEIAQPVELDEKLFGDLQLELNTVQQMLDQQQTAESATAAHSQKRRFLPRLRRPKVVAN